MADTPSAEAPKPRKPAAPRKPRATKAATAPVVAAEPGAEPAKAKFAKAIEDAKAGAEALRGEARARAGAYREQLGSKSEELVGEARALGDQAKEKATELAYEGKAKASSALVGLGQIVEENAPAIDEKLGPKYGDYARQAARAMNDTAAKIDAKDLNELGEDAKEFVRKSPGLAIGMAAAAGFLLSRLFKKSDD
jgi:ElaB/YqjD/DUF883 family membrane-anchored ribosome-binding protein